LKSEVAGFDLTQYAETPGVLGIICSREERSMDAYTIGIIGLVIVVGFAGFYLMRPEQK
jgi:hypothetical protein